MVVEMIHSQMTSYCILGVNLGILEYGPVPGLIFLYKFPHSGNRQFPWPRPTGNFYHSGDFNKDTTNQ